MVTELTKYWKLKNKIPYGLIENSDPRLTVYTIAIFRFNKKQALLVNKNLDIICHMETRYAQKLIDEAKENDWITVEMEDTKHGPRDSNYPEIADYVCWVEIKK